MTEENTTTPRRIKVAGNTNASFSAEVVKPKKKSPGIVVLRNIYIMPATIFVEPLLKEREKQ